MHAEQRQGGSGSKSVMLQGLMVAVMGNVDHYSGRTFVGHKEN